mgnify:CR=1 FL=1
MMISSQIHEDWNKAAHWVAKKAMNETARKFPLRGFTQIRITFTPPNKRNGDLTNRAESIMDLLAEAGIIEDDNWFEVPDLHLRRGPVDKINPGALVEIWEASV